MKLQWDSNKCANSKTLVVDMNTLFQGSFFSVYWLISEGTNLNTVRFGGEGLDYEALLYSF